MIAYKLAHTAEGCERVLKIFKYNRLLVLIERLVNIGDIAVEHIEKAAVLNYNNAVALGVTLRLDKINAVTDYLAFGEIIVRTVGKGNGNDIVNTL